jgi:hypothetical protein
MRYVAMAAVLAAAMYAPPTVAGPRTKPTACPGGRFPVGDALVPGGTTGTTGDAVVISDTQVSVESGCPTTTAKRRVTRGATVLVARWDGCGTLPGRVRLVVKLDGASCETLRGRFTNRKGKINRRLLAQLDMPAGAFGGPRDPLPPGAQMVSEAEFDQLKTRPDFHGVDANQIAADAAELAQRDAQDEQIVMDFVGQNPALASQYLGGVDPSDPSVTQGDDGNYLRTFTDDAGASRTVVTQGPRWFRRVAAGGIRTFPTRNNQLVLYSHFFESLQGLDPALVGNLPSPDQVAGYGLADLVALNVSLTNQLSQYLTLVPPPGGTPPPGYPASCDAEEGAGDGSDRSGSSTACATHSSVGVYANRTWPLKFFATCVKDQANRGTCWDFATTAAVELWTAKKYGRWVNLSEQDMNLHMKADWRPTAYGDGEWPGNALAAMIVSNLLPDPFNPFRGAYSYPFEEQWDYDPSDSRTSNDMTQTYTNSCVGYGGDESAYCSDTAAQGRYVCTTVLFVTYCGMVGPPITTTSGLYPTAYSELWDASNPSNSLGLIFWALGIFQKPVIFGFAAPASFWVGSSGYVPYRGPHCPLTMNSQGKTVCVPGAGCECDVGGHAVLATGFIDNSQLPAGAPPGSGGGYLIIKNSWSNCYGDAGYSYLPYDWVKAYALAVEVVGDIT